MNRRKFLKQIGAGALLAWSVRPEFALGKTLKPGRTWQGDEKVTLPEWQYGDNSTAKDTVLMFRGDPKHRFYGTGPLPNSLKKLWEFRTEDFETTLRGKPKVWSGTGWTGQASHLAGYVYFGSQDRHLYCLRAGDGKLMWKYRGYRMFKGSLCIYKNRIYAPNVDDRLHCLDAETGKRLWRHDTGRDLDSSPCVVDGKLYIAGENGHVRCLDPETGKLHWKHFVGGIGPGTKPGSNGAEGSVAVDGDDIIVGNFDGEVCCISVETGKRKWTAKTGDDTDVSAILDDEHVYIAAEEKSPYLYCLERSTGKTVWKFKNRRGWYSTPALVDGKLYIGGNGGHFYCINAANGKEAWKYKAEAPIWCSPAVVDGKVLFGSYGKHLVMLESATGKELQTIDLRGRIHSAPCVVDGKVYVGTAAGWFYCLG